MLPVAAPTADSVALPIEPLIDPASRWLYASPHDIFAWEQLRTSSAALDQLAEYAAGRLPSVEALMADLFAAFYRADVRRAEASDPVAEINKPILDRVLSSPAYQRLHTETNGRPADTALMIDAFVRSLSESIEPELAEFLDAEQRYHAGKADLEAQAEALRALSGKRGRKSRAPEPGEDEEILAPEDLSAGQRKERLASLQGEIEAAEHAHRTDYRLMRARRQMRQFVEDVGVGDRLENASTAVEDFQQAITAWGADPGAPISLSLDERLNLFHRFMADDSLRRATELLGRARTRAAGAHRSRTPAAPTQVETVEFGNDLAAVLPSELIYLAEPDAQVEFYRRYATDELLLRKYRMEGAPERGPLLVLLDESASMNGEADLIAKSLALALIGVATTDKRAAALIEFASAGEQRITHFAPGAASLTDVAAALTHHFNGGTNFDVPLAAALDIVERDARYATADIVIVTDGEAPLHDDTIERLRAASKEGARLHALCVGIDDRTFRDVAYRSWPLADLVAERDNPQILSQLVDAIH